jgi:hypothetical protein
MQFSFKNMGKHADSTDSKILRRIQFRKRGRLSGACGPLWSGRNGTYLSQEPPSFRRRPESRNTATIKQSGSRPAPG